MLNIKLEGQPDDVLMQDVNASLPSASHHSGAPENASGPRTLLGIAQIGAGVAVAPAEPESTYMADGTFWF